MFKPALTRTGAAAHLDDARPRPPSSRDMTQTATPHVQPFTRTELHGAVELFAAAGWDVYTVDPERTFRALSAPGCTTLVALDGAAVVALVQLQSDGEIEAHLSALLVAGSWRGHGLGRELLGEALRLAGGIRVNVLTHAEAFYHHLGGQRTPGFRLARVDLDDRRIRGGS
jgi:GNAT superfamily N-acetyltransferase